MADPNDSLENAAMPVETQQLADLATSLATNPATRKDFLRLLKKQNPAQVVPELDAEDSIRAAVKPLEDRLAAMGAEHLKEQVEGRIERQRAALRKEGHTDSDIAAIEKLMVEKSIPIHATAANYYKMERQLADPTPGALTTTGSNTLPIDREAVKKDGGLKSWARNEAHRAAADIKTGRVRLH